MATLTTFVSGEFQGLIETSSPLRRLVMDIECLKGVTRNPDESEGVEGTLRASVSSPWQLDEEEVVQERSSPMEMGRLGVKKPRL